MSCDVAITGSGGAGSRQRSPRRPARLRAVMIDHASRRPVTSGPGREAAGAARVADIHIAAEGADDANLAAPRALAPGVPGGQLAASQAPYLTTGQGRKLAARTFGDVARLSGCVA